MPETGRNLSETPLQGAREGNGLKESNKNWKQGGIIDPWELEVSALSNTGISHGGRRGAGDGM